MNIDMDDVKDTLAMLRTAVEQRFKAGVNSPAEFKRLSESIGQSDAGSVSDSTLMRIWGYTDGGTNPNRSTLNTLARYAGYHDYEQFIAFCDEDSDSSDDVMSPHINVLEDLQIHDRVLLRWHSGRECLLRYLGNARFVVVSSERTRLKPGDSFVCYLIIEGQQLFVDNLVQGNSAPRAYTCGMTGGVHFTLIDKK